MICDLPLNFTRLQKKVFIKQKAKKKIYPKGRREGFTQGLARYFLYFILNSDKPALWVDVTNGNINRYVERIFLPILKPLPKKDYRWRERDKILSVGNNYIDFRSAEEPKNIEGFGYGLIGINESGEVLQNRYIYEERILPTTIDYNPEVIIGGVPKGKRNHKNKNEKHLFFELFEKALKNEQNYTAILNNDINFYNEKNIDVLLKLYKPYTAFDNTTVSKEALQELLEYYQGTALEQQEIWGKFVDEILAGIIKREWWDYLEVIPQDWIRKIQFWDTAFKSHEENDFSACANWYEYTNYYLLANMWAERIETPQLIQEMKNKYADFKPDIVVIEDKGSGTTSIQTLRNETKIPVIEFKPLKDKIERANNVAPLFKSGYIKILKGNWNDKVINQCADFPNVEHDDITDAVVESLLYMQENVFNKGTFKTGINKSVSNRL